jgi:hypothetical protein
MSVANEQVQPDLVFPHLLQSYCVVRARCGCHGAEYNGAVDSEQPRDLHPTLVIFVAGATCLRA